MTVDKWDRRQLCEDGACTGVIGQDGTCKTCGKPASDFGDLRKPGRVSSKSDVDEEPVQDDADDDAEPTTAKPASPAKVAAKGGKVAAWNERRLCSDGNCIGLIADDGKCKVCGTPADGAGDELAAHGSEAEEEEEEEAEAGGDGEDADDGEDDEDDEDDDEDAEVAQDEDAEADEDDDEDDDEDEDADDEADEGDRKLCSDGACIGVIGDDGKCKTCGKAAA